MPDYYPTSTHSYFGGDEGFIAPVGTLHGSVDEVGAPNGDTDYIESESFHEGYTDVFPPFESRVIFWLSETDLPIPDATGLNGAILKIQAKTVAEDVGMGWQLRVKIGIGDPADEMYIGQAVFDQDDIGSSYAELQVPINNALLPGLEPSNLRAYVVLDIWHT
jgi:hypothetical protein